MAILACMHAFLGSVTLLAGLWMSDGERALRPLPNDGLTCSGNLVLLGDTKQAVAHKCGQPQRVEPYCAYSAGRYSCWESWVYILDPGSFPRRVIFDYYGHVIGIVAGSKFERP